MPSTQPHAWLGQLKILLSAIGFGSMAIFARFAYEDGVSTPTLLFLRFALAGALLLPWCLAKRLEWPRGQSLLVAVGAMHMTGPRALPALLREHGFEVTLMPPSGSR